MAMIKHMFHEVQYELVKIILLDVFLSTVIVFLVADVVSLVFNMPIWYVIAVSFIYFGVVLYHDVQKISYKQVEKNNPDLQEIFRTARDNSSEESLMAHALFQEVIEKMRKVSSGTFIDFKKLVTRLGIIFALSIFLISIAFFNVNLARFDNPLEKPLNIFSGFFGGDSSAVEGVDIDPASDDIFGSASMAQLGDDQLVATVNPSLSNPDFNDLSDPTLSSDPLKDLGEGGAEFNTPGAAGSSSGLDEKDLQRSYNYAKSLQGG